ncbi:MAG TPA: hypothetical protein VHY82_02370 [Acetobacteraceae bacterium]|nr:hypothetical protein [Acetobacteraceae bacterium]
MDDHIAELARAAELKHRYVEPSQAGAEAGFAGARVKSRDPLALFAHDAAVKVERQTVDLRKQGFEFGVATVAERRHDYA